MLLTSRRVKWDYLGVDRAGLLFIVSVYIITPLTIKNVFLYCIRCKSVEKAVIFVRCVHLVKGRDEWVTMMTTVQHPITTRWGYWG